MLRTIRVSVLSVLVLGAASAANIPFFTPATPVDLAGVPLPAGDISATMAACSNTASSAGNVCNGANGSLYPQGNTYMNFTFSHFIKTNAPLTTNANQTVTTGSTSSPFLLGSQPSNSDQMLAVGGGQGVDSQIVVDLNGYNPVTNNAAGVFDIADVETMIQGDQMNPGFTGVSVILAGLDATGHSASYTFVLTAGTDYRGYSSTQTVVSDIAGSGITQQSAADNNASCSEIDNGSPTATAGCSILVSNNSFGGLLSGTNYFMDVQELQLGSNNPFANGGLLQSITVSSDAFGPGNSSTPVNGTFPDGSAILLSGIDLVTPEPGTIFLFAAGLGLVGLRLKRRSGTAAR